MTAPGARAAPRRGGRGRVYVAALDRAGPLGVPRTEGVVGAVYDRRVGNVVACLPGHGLGRRDRRAGLHFGDSRRRFLVVCRPRDDLPDDPGLPDGPVEMRAADPRAALMLAEGRVCGPGRVGSLAEVVVRVRRVGP